MGAFTLALGLVGILQLVTDFGFQGVVVREISQSVDRTASLVSNLLYLRFAAGFVAYGLLVALVFVLPLTDAERSASLIAGVILMVTSLEALTVALQRDIRTTPIAVGSVVSAVLFLAGALILISMGASLEAILWARTGATLLGLLVPTVVVIRSYRLDWRVRPEAWLALSRVAIPIGVAFAMNYVYYRIDIVFLAALSPSDDVGQYGVAYRVIDSLMMVPGMILFVLRPVMAQSYSAGIDVLRRRYDRALYAMMVPAALLAVIGAFTAWRVLPAVPGLGDYKGAGVALSILLPAFSFIFVAHLVQTTVVSTHLQVKLIGVSVLALAINVVLNLILIPPFSYIGAAVSTLATEGVVLVASALLLVRNRGLPVAPPESWRLAVGCILVGVVAAAGLAVPWPIQLGLIAVAVPLALWVTSAVTADLLGGLGVHGASWVRRKA